MKRKRIYTSRLDRYEKQKHIDAYNEMIKACNTSIEMNEGSDRINKNSII